MTVQHIEIEQDIPDSAWITPEEVRIELALTLYSQRRLSFGKACELANLGVWEFRQRLAARHIPAHHNTDDLTNDIETLARLRSK